MIPERKGHRCHRGGNLKRTRIALLFMFNQLTVIVRFPTALSSRISQYRETTPHAIAGFGGEEQVELDSGEGALPWRSRSIPTGLRTWVAGSSVAMPANRLSALEWTTTQIVLSEMLTISIGGLGF
jgi:hypothetical protein